MIEWELTQSYSDGKTVYGVRTTKAENLPVAYPEISSDRHEAEMLLQRMGQSDLSPLHFDDVVRDYLLELAYKRMARNGLE